MLPTPDEKTKIYQLTLEQIKSTTEAETDPIALLASVACLLKANLAHFFWVGFYRVDPAKRDELVVGPYQGTFGCLRIPFGRGVCGTCAAHELPVIVPNVNQFPGHIACDSRSASEIALPVFDCAGKLYAVLDVDSTELEAFQDEDCEGLENILEVIEAKL